MLVSVPYFDNFTKWSIFVVNGPKKYFDKIRWFLVRILFPTMTLVTVMMRLSLQMNFIDRKPIYGIFLQGKGCFWPLLTRMDSIGHQSLHQWSRGVNQGLEVMYPQSILYLTMQLTIFFYQFRCVWVGWSVESCDMSKILGLVVRFSIRTTFGSDVWEKAIWRARQW